MKFRTADDKRHDVPVKLTEFREDGGALPTSLKTKTRGEMTTVSDDIMVKYIPHVCDIIYTYATS